MRSLPWGRILCGVGIVGSAFGSESEPVASAIVFATLIIAAVALHGIAVWRSVKLGSR